MKGYSAWWAWLGIGSCWLGGVMRVRSACGAEGGVARTFLLEEGWHVIAYVLIVHMH